MTTERTLPRTRIATLFLWVNRIALVLVIIAFCIGFFGDPKKGSIIPHLSLGLGATLFGMFGLVSAMFYLITTGAAIKEAVIKRSVPMEVYRRTGVLKKHLFPWCSAVILMLIVTTVLGGFTHVEKVSPYVHLAAAGFLVAVYVKAIKSMQENFQINREIMGDALAHIDAKAGN